MSQKGVKLTNDNNFVTHQLQAVLKPKGTYRPSMCYRKESNFHVMILQSSTLNPLNGKG